MGACLFFNRANPQPLFATIHLTLRDFAGWTNASRTIAATAFKTTSRKATPLAAFSTRFFCNDLVGVFNHADSINSRRLHDYAEFLYNYAPQACYGFPESLTEAWIKSGSLIGQTTTA